MQRTENISAPAYPSELDIYYKIFIRCLCERSVAISKLIVINLKKSPRLSKAEPRDDGSFQEITTSCFSVIREDVC